MAALPALIMGGAAVVDAFTRNKAADKAATTQERGADRALALQREMYERGQASLAPYQQAGAGAVGTLAGLMGLPMGAGGGPQPDAPPPAIPVEQRARAFADERQGYLGQHGRGLVDQFKATRAAREAYGRGTASSYGPPTSRSRGGSLSSLGRPSGGPRMVLMLSPDGTEREEVPESEVPELERMGARRA